MNYVERLKQYLTGIYDRNSFVSMLDMAIENIAHGRAEVTMPVNPAKHTNLYNVAHGGAIASLADTAMGIACATMGNRVVTIDMNINFMRSAEKNSVVRASAQVLHAGRQTMVAEADIFDTHDGLLAKARATFMVIGKFDEVVVQDV
ncbi:MAG: PaaI family thioesterase [Negativicutes bacterium]|nr:PaaI family thioesterase [Negativicutes bacterium]